MADPFHLRRNVVTSVIAFAATIAVTFISYRLVVLHGGLGAVGLWSNLMAWIFLIRLGDVGMANAAVRFAAALDPAEEPEQVRRHIDTAFVLNAALFLLLTAAGWALYAANLRHIVPGSEADVEIARAILPLLFAGFLLQNLSGLALGALRAIHRGYVAAWLSVAGTVLQLVVVVPLVGKIGLAALAWGQIAQYGLMLPNGWWRVALTGVAAVTTNGVYLQANTGLFAGDQAFAGDGSSGFYAWGAQLETGASASSYVATAGAAATRAADLAGLLGITATCTVTLTYDDLSSETREAQNVSPGWWPSLARPRLRALVLR